MSPSGFPLLHVIRAAGIVNAIVFSLIKLNTLLSSTVPPKSVQLGNDIVVKIIHILKHSEPIVTTHNQLVARTGLEPAYFIEYFIHIGSVLHCTT